MQTKTKILVTSKLQDYRSKIQKSTNMMNKISVNKTTILPTIYCISKLL